MKTRSSARPLFILLASLLFSSDPSLLAQTNFNVSTAADLSNAVAQAFSDTVNNNWTDTITLQGNISSASQFFLDANVNIVGNGYSIDMNNADRAFFIAGGNVNISDLSIANGNASGGSGANGGGGGAGLGGGIFVGSGSYLGGSGAQGGGYPTNVAYSGVSTPNVTLNNVQFQNNQAFGGSALPTQANPGGGGGGGMGGNGGMALFTSDHIFGGGGGGGFGVGANGGGWSNSSDQSSIYAAGGGAFLGGASGGSGQSGQPGGTNGGGGGSSWGLAINGAAGGGGIDGLTVPSITNSGGNGGFGGGGGGEMFNVHSGGNGGFGGGGGAAGEGEDASSQQNGGSGGFGGGGGAGKVGTSGGGLAGWGGFGAGAGNLNGQGSDPTLWQGGGGLGAGGALFVMAGAAITINGGSFTSNNVAAGTGFVNGSAYGADLFLGSDVTFNVTNGSTLTVNSLGGAGNTNDPNVNQYNGYMPQSNDIVDPNAQGGIIKTGGGTLTMTGSNYYSGATVIHQGALALGAGVLEQGTSQVIVGQSNGDNAILMLGSSSILNVSSGANPALILGREAGSTGTVVIGSGTGSSGAFLGANVIEGGAGGGSVVFNQEYAAGSNAPSVYPFYVQLTGNLQVIQNGPGTTFLAPDPNGNGNTFTGGVVINNGTLELNAPPLEEYGWALPIGSSVTINTNGSLNLGGAGTVNSSSAGTLTLNGGSIYGGVIGAQIVQATSGSISAIIHAAEFVQNGQGTTIVSGGGIGATGGSSTNSCIFITSGTLVLGSGAWLQTFQGDIIVGQQVGSATLVMQGGSSISSWDKNSTVLLGEDSGSYGTLVISPNASIENMGVVQGGSGGGDVILQGPGTSSVSPFGVTLTGNLRVVSEGGGTTVLKPDTYGPNTFTGGVEVDQGTLQLGNGNALPSGSAITLNGGVFDLGGNSVSGGLLTLNGGTLTNSSGNQTISPGNTITTSGIIAVSIAGTGGLTQQGEGTTVLAAANTFSGGVTVNGGTLQLGTNTAFPIGNPITLNGGIFDLNGNSVSVGELSVNGGTLTNSSGNQAINPSNTITTSGIIAVSIAGVGGVTQQGEGTTVLAAANTFSGGVTVNGGTLVAASSGSLGGSGEVTLQGSEATLALGATNAVYSGANFTLHRGTIQIVSNLSQSLGIFTVLDGGARLDFGGYAASLTMFDALYVSGATLAIWNWNAADDSIFITADQIYSYKEVKEVSFYSDNGTTEIGTGVIEYGQLQAVPEPSTYLLLGLGALAMVIAARRKLS